MKVTHTNKLISVVLVLSMLLGMFTVLSFGGAVSAAEGEDVQTNPTLGETDELRFAEKFYQSKWAGSYIASAGYGHWVASDGVGNGAMQWGAGYTSASVDEEGVLSFPATGNPSLKFMPYQNSAHNIQAGPIRVQFEIFYDESMPAITYETGDGSGGSWLFYVMEDGKVYYNNNRYWPDGKVATPYTFKAGWNTVEMIFIPELADGTISTSKSDTVAVHRYYMRVYHENDGITSAGKYTPAELLESFYQKNLSPAVDKTQYVTIASKAYIKPATKEGGVMKLRNVQAMNLIPYVRPISDEESALPVQGYAVNANGYTSKWAGSSFATGGTWGQWVKSDSPYSGVLQWTPSYTGASVNSEGILSFDVTSGTPSIQLLPWQGTNVTINPGPVRLAFDIWYDGNTPKITCKGPNGTIWYFYIDENGKLKYNDTNYWWAGSSADTGFTLQAGWNTVEMIIIPKLADGTISTSKDDTLAVRHLYLRSIPSVEIHSSTFGYTEKMLSDPNEFYHAKITNASILKHFISGGTGMTLTADKETDGVLKLRSAKIGNLTADSKLHQLKTENGNTYMPTSYTNKSYALPSGGMDAWMFTAPEGIVTLGKAGGTLNFNGNYESIGAKVDTSKFGRASISLGSEMTLNMKVNPDVLTAGNLESMMAFADGTALGGVADAALDAYGYHNIPIKGILARDMWRDLNLYLVTRVDGQYYISPNVQVYSPMIYLERMYTKSAEDVKTLLATMANYGAAAEEQYYDGSNNMRTAMTALGITNELLPSFPTDASVYARPEITDENKDIINTYVNTGATLSENLTLVLEKSDNVDIKGVTVTLRAGEEAITREYTFGADDKLYITDLNAAYIRNIFTISFIGNDNTVKASTDFTIGNFLYYRHANGDAAEKALAEATILYMLQVREYVMNAQA